jgi:hypothetical protein
MSLWCYPYCYPNLSLSKSHGGSVARPRLARRGTFIASVIAIDTSNEISVS